MIESALQLAKKLWEQLAHQAFSWGFVHQIEANGYATIEIIPYKHLEDTITSRHGILRSFVWSKAKLFCTVVGNKHHIRLLCSVPKHLLPTLEASLYANIKYMDIRKVDNPSLKWYKYVNQPRDAEYWLHDLDFKKDASYLDPFLDILATYDQVIDNTLTISYCFDFDTKHSQLKKIGGLLLSVLFGSYGESPEKKQKQHLIVKASIWYGMEHNDRSLHEAVQSCFGKFAEKKISRANTAIPLHLELSQISNFFHIPSHSINGLEYLPYRKLPSPNNLPTLQSATDKNELTVIGKTEYRGVNQAFGILREDKLRHMYIIWKTWVGKSNLIANLARSDMISNKGICVIDPHGDLVDDIIAQVPSYRINDVVLFDVADREWPVWFNVLEYDKPEEKPLIASGIVSIFKKIYGNSRGPRLEYILRNVLLSILEYPNATLMHILRMLTDDNFRTDVLEYVKDPVLLNFWKDEFEAWPDKQREEAISPISNKVGQFTSSQIIRNIFSQQKSKINFRRLMDEGKIILINLSKGKIGEDNTNLLGSFVVSKIQIDAMSRADMDEDQRKDFYLYIDEFQNFATESFATILSEARKYRLWLILANQYSSQLDEVTRGAIFGNVGTMISMTLGYDDAVIMANQFKSMVSANDFLDIPKYKAYIKLMTNWIVSDPFTMQTIALPPWDDVMVLKEKIRNQSRQRYAVPRLELEELVKKRAERSFSKMEKAVLKAKEKNGTKGVKEVKISDKKQKNVIDGEVKSVTKENWNTNNKPVQSSINLPVNFDISLFDLHTVGDCFPDAILRDAVKRDHKIIYYNLPVWLDAELDSQKQKWKWYKKWTMKIYKVFVDMYQHNNLKSPDKDGVDIWVWTKDEVLQQVQNWFQNTEKRFLVEREYNQTHWEKNDSEDNKIEDPIKHNKVDLKAKDDPIIQNEVDMTLGPISHKESEDVDPQDTTTISEYAWIKIGKTYEWYVKLKYNYGLFVTVGELDWLLHKKLIDAWEGISRKKLYEIGDPIVVKAIEIKELDGRITVVWSQL